MTLEQYTEKLQHAVLNADEAPAIVNEVLGELKTDLTTSATLKAQTETDAKTIADLRDTNMKLFLAQGGSIKEEEKEEEKPSIDWDAIVKEVKGDK